MTDNNSYTASSSSFPPSDWVETTLGEVCEIKNGKTNSQDANENGKYPLFDRSSVIKKSNKFIFDAKAIIIPGEGAEFIPRYFEGKFDLHQRAYAIYKFKQDIADPLYFFYQITNSRVFFEKIAVGSTVKSLRINHFIEFPILLPPLPEQQAIASVLSAFDDKIELLREQNKTLEEMGQVIFQEWFGKYGVDDELPEWWRVGKVKDIVDIFDSQRIPLSSNQRQEKQGKYPYHGATSIMDYVDEYLFDGIYLLLAEDGSVMDQNGYPVLQYVWGKFWVNNHAHVLQGANEFSTEMLYLLFKNTKIAGIVNGAVQLKINQANLMNLDVIIPDQEILKQFNEAIQPIFAKIRDNSEQIQSLARSRDELLPKLMSGEVRVDNFNF